VLGEPRLDVYSWLRFGPFLAQLVVIRRCNLSCGYCSEYDKTSAPVPIEALRRRLEDLHRLRTWAVCLTGGEPTLHPDLVLVVREMTRLGFRRRQLITNGYLLTRELVESLNEAGLTDLQISVDGVRPNATTSKVLKPLRSKLELLARHARFAVVMSGVIGSAPAGEALETIEFAMEHRFTPRILLIHDENGRLKLGVDEMAEYVEAQRRLGRHGREAGDYRRRLLDDGVAPFRCRSGSRYLYVDENGDVSWCAQTRAQFRKSLSEYGIEDLRRQFAAPKACNTRCTIGCARTASAFDHWRPQDDEGAAERARSHV